MPWSHHERWDGSGYGGLAAEDIPIAGRIATVADVFDALTHERPYKRAWPAEEALAEIASQRGKQFDPTVVDAFAIDLITSSLSAEQADVVLRRVIGDLDVRTVARIGRFGVSQLEDALVLGWRLSWIHDGSLRLAKRDLNVLPHEWFLSAANRATGHIQSQRRMENPACEMPRLIEATADSERSSPYLFWGLSPLRRRRTITHLTH